MPKRQKREHANRDIITGIIKLHRRGFGFVSPEDNTLYNQDIFIPKQLTQNAVDGDTVEVEVNPFFSSEKGPEGKITAILKRSKTHLSGIITEALPEGSYLAYAPLLGVEKRVMVEPHEELLLKEGDRVVMEVLEWGTREKQAICRASHLLGHISEAKWDVPAAVEAFEIRSEFPSDAIKEALSFGKQVSLKDIRGRKDLRDLECITIDPDTAKDFDDALSLTKDKKGRYKLGVHIADVSHYVKSGSALDREAKQRCNSTYFPGTAIPMLPGSLSENLCSLKPNVNRLAISVFIHFDANGEMVHYEFFRSVIKSQKRLTYKQAKLILDGKRKSKHAPLVHLLAEFCHVLKKKRYERGCIEFSLPELCVLIDPKGNPTGTELVSYDITHQLVEECMLKANEVVATHLSQKGKEITYRIHEEPSSENIKDFSLLAQGFGFKIPKQPTAQELQTFFDEALNTPIGSFLATNYIRCMKLAVYSPENIGHYGLGLSHYCHFTSPIRRYVDLVVHRILFDEEHDYVQLEKIANQSSEQERVSEKAENSVKLLKKLRLLEEIQKKEPLKQFEVVVTRVRNFGFYFEVLDLMLEGFFHVSELHDDYYEFDEKKAILYGVHSGSRFFVGDKIQVNLRKVDLILLQAEWDLYLNKQQRERKDRRSKNRKDRHKSDKRHKRS